MRLRIYVGIIIFLSFLLFNANAHSYQKVFYVSTIGSDDWSGILPSPDAGKTDGPFATLEKARDAVRIFKGSNRMPEDGIVVYLRGGIYTITKTFDLTEEDSGTEEDAGADAVGNDDEAANVPFKKRGVATPRGVSEKRKKTKKKRGENMPKTVRVSRRLQDLRPVLEGSPDDWDNLAPTDPVEGWAARSCFSEPISVDELKEFCAVLWRCSMDRPHELEAIWAGDRNVKYDFSTMPRNRFLEILRCFLFSHAQVLQVIELINLVMADVWAASNVVVVDETMCAFKGRKDNPHHVFICRKPKPNGIKMWTTCDASGVVLKTSLFERVNVNGKKTEKEFASAAAGHQQGSSRKRVELQNVKLTCENCDLGRTSSAFNQNSIGLPTHRNDERTS